MLDEVEYNPVTWVVVVVRAPETRVCVLGLDGVDASGYCPQNGTIITLTYLMTVWMHSSFCWAFHPQCGSMNLITLTSTVSYEGISQSPYRACHNASLTSICLNLSGGIQDTLHMAYPAWTLPDLC